MTRLRCWVAGSCQTRWYVDNLADPGGETNMGISKRQYPQLDIKNLTLDQAAEIYPRDYSTPAGCDGLPDGAALAVFDTAVNIGVGRATAMWSASGDDVEQFLWARLASYSGLTKLQQFVAGWLRRVVLLGEAVHRLV